MLKNGKIISEAVLLMAEQLPVIQEETRTKISCQQDFTLVVIEQGNEDGRAIAKHAVEMILEGLKDEVISAPAFGSIFENSIQQI